MKQSHRKAFGLAMALGIIAFVVHQTMTAPSRRLRANRRPVPTRTVLFATRDIARQQEITPDLVEARNIEARYLPDSGYAKAMSEVKGKAAAAPIHRGEILQIRRLAPRDAAQTLSTLLREGKRAFTIALTTKDAALQAQ